jgi:hypothetical protein
MDHRADQITRQLVLQAIDLIHYFVENCSQRRKVRQHSRPYGR